MIPTPYKCKQCHQDHVAFASDDGDPEWNRQLATILVCNRCADYLHGKRKYGEAIARVCCNIRQSDLLGKRDSALIEAAQAKLHTLTQAYADCVSKYNNLQIVWDQQFIDQLIDYPDKVWIILRAYEDGLSKI